MLSLIDYKHCFQIKTIGTVVHFNLNRFRTWIRWSDMFWNLSRWELMHVSFFIGQSVLECMIRILKFILNLIYILSPCHRLFSTINSKKTSSNKRLLTDIVDLSSVSKHPCVCSGWSWVEIYYRANQICTQKLCSCLFCRLILKKKNATISKDIWTARVYVWTVFEISVYSMQWKILLVYNH